MGGDTSDNLLQALLQDLQGGFFRLDAQGRFVEMDDAVRALLQVDIGEEWPQVCFEREAARAFLEKTKQEGIAVSPRTLLLCRRKGKGEGQKGFAPFWARVYLIAEYDASGQFQGWRGYMRDVTAEEVRKRLEELPVGFYVLKRDTKGDERIVYASPKFAHIYQFSSPEEVLGAPIRKFFPSFDNYQRFLQYLKRWTQERETTSMLGWKNEIRDKHDQRHHITADIKWRLKNDIIEERWGLLREARFDTFFESLVREYAVVLHTYSTALIGASHALDALKEIMKPDPFERNPQKTLLDERFRLDSEVEQLLDKAWRQLQSALQAVLQQAQERGLQASELERFEKYLERLDKIEGFSLPWRIPVFLEMGSRVLRHTQRLREKRPAPPQPWFAREVLRRVRVAAWDLARLAALIIIYQSQVHIVEVGHEVRLFRDFWMQPLRMQTHEKVDVIRVLEESMLGLDDFARKRGVQWRRYGAWPEYAWVQGDQRSLQRAFSHLLHNAIKYSWKRARGTWIGIRVTSEENTEGQWWRIEIENYGVPIAEDELKNIFQFGYRGRLSQDKARVGTGIGLYDARRVFEDHGGKLSLDSRPAHPADSQLHPKTRSSDLQPHIVTTRVWLPILKGGK